MITFNCITLSERLLDVVFHTSVYLVKLYFYYIAKVSNYVSLYTTFSYKGIKVARSTAMLFHLKKHHRYHMM